MGKLGPSLITKVMSVVKTESNVVTGRQKYYAISICKNK